jgi:hypothetical protein
MTKKKRLLLLSILPLTIALTLGVLAMLPPRPGVTKANFDRIEKGMTRDEVEQIFGRKGEVARDDKTVLNWEADDGSEVFIVIWDDCILHKYWRCHDSDKTILDKLRRWFHLT